MRKKREFSKTLAAAVILCGFVIAQECLALMWLCIRSGFDASAAWLTAGVGLAEAVIGTGLAGYLSLCKADHTEGGITFEAAKAKNYDNSI